MQGHLLYLPSQRLAPPRPCAYVRAGREECTDHLRVAHDGGRVQGREERQLVAEARVRVGRQEHAHQLLVACVPQATSHMHTSSAQPSRVVAILLAPQRYFTGAVTEGGQCPGPQGPDGPQLHATSSAVSPAALRPSTSTPRLMYSAILSSLPVREG